jgi:hypothetical protein
LPLVHIASGVDPATGKRRVAKGIVAMGDKAKGVVAMGGIATGFLAFGGMAFGVIPIGGFSFGLFACGGFALGLIAGYGGMVVAPIAMGGLAIGYYALGGGGWGVHMVSGKMQDPAAKQFFKHLRGPAIFYAMMFLVLVPTAISVFVPLWMQRRADRKTLKR